MGEDVAVPRPARGRAQRLVGLAAFAGLVATVGVLWSSSRLPAAYSVSSMGTVDGGGGPASVGHVGAHVETHAVGRSLTTLAVDAARPADARFVLVARHAAYDVPGGRRVEGFTVNGTSPGPVLRVRQGQLVEVRFVNESVASGATLHWHGIDVPNSQDGVAGVTQDAVPMGGAYTYRFVAKDAGTYWYHSHQVSHDQVLRGLLGGLVVEPSGGSAGSSSGVRDVVALLHSYDGQPTLNGRLSDERVVAAAGEPVRVRVINTDNVLTSVWASGGFLLAAVDGTDVHGPTEVRGQRVGVAAGGRVDLVVTTPPDGSAVRLQLGGSRSVVIGPAGIEAPRVAQPGATLDLLHYGTPAPLGLDPAKADRRFDYVIGRRPGLLDGRPGLFWTVNGRLFPDVPMFHVREGDVVRVRFANDSSEAHPMHLHGHHVVVLSRDGVAATGSPWWVDSLEVAAGESYEVAFVADNPGIWMDHCHNLPHATDGLVAHLAYEGVTTPFLMRGPAGNEPE